MLLDFGRHRVGCEPWLRSSEFLQSDVLAHQEGRIGLVNPVFSVIPVMARVLSRACVAFVKKKKKGLAILRFAGTVDGHMGRDVVILLDEVDIHFGPSPQR